MEILAGGTLALLADLGHSITIVTFTPGDCGSHDRGPEEIASVRRREASSAAARIGARYLCLEMRDLVIFNDDTSRRRVTDVLRTTRPEIVLAPSPADYLCDHEIASALVRDACFAAPLTNYPTVAPPIGAIPHLYFMDPVGGRDRDNCVIRPDFVVNVEATFERKRSMLAEHASQREWLRQHHGIDDYLEEMERWTRERGSLAGLTHGEGFRQYRGHAYPLTPLLEDSLGGAVTYLR